jgi:hypothetical protein
MLYLADFMEATAAPPKWKFLTAAEKHERASRMHVSLLEFPAEKEPIETEVSSIEELVSHLRDSVDAKRSTAPRLFVVEDLSRAVIEALGACLDIDPLFFRNHISDYQWYNTRDPWVEVPDLSLLTKERTFWNIEYRHARYFRTRESFDTAQDEAGKFNVMRRLEDHGNHKRGIDEPNSVVATVRSKTGLWLRKPDGQHSGIVGKPCHQIWPLLFSQR